jgi:hypothetical protein
MNTFYAEAKLKQLGLKSYGNNVLTRISLNGNEVNAA